MLSSEFVAFAKRCKDAFGTIFRNGARVKPFPHDVYSWKAIAIDREGNVMLFGGEHGSSNPEHIIGVLNGKAYATEHSNGRFQQACRTIDECRDTYPFIHSIGVCGGAKEVDTVGMTLEQAETAFNMLTNRAEEQKAKNAAEDAKNAELREFCKGFFIKRDFVNTLKNNHRRFFEWCGRLENEKKKNWCSQGRNQYGTMGWHSNVENVYFRNTKDGYQGFKFSCTDKKAEGIEVSEKTFYKELVRSLEERAESLSEISQKSVFLSYLMCTIGNFTLVYNADGTRHYYIKGMGFNLIPKSYPFGGLAWRDGLRKATEEEEKSVKKWVKCGGSNPFDVAMVNWQLRLWRDPTEEELKALP